MSTFGEFFGRFFGRFFGWPEEPQFYCVAGDTFVAARVGDYFIPQAVGGQFAAGAAAGISEEA